VSASAVQVAKDKDKGKWVTDTAKTKHFHNRLEIFGPFVINDEIKDHKDAICAKQYCRWILDHKDLTSAEPASQHGYGFHPTP
jgi:hypothetical protein